MTLCRSTTLTRQPDLLSSHRRYVEFDRSLVNLLTCDVSLLHDRFTSLKKRLFRSVSTPCFGNWDGVGARVHALEQHNLHTDFYIGMEPAVGYVTGRTMPPSFPRNRLANTVGLVWARPGFANAVGRLQTLYVHTVFANAVGCSQGKISECQMPHAPWRWEGPVLCHAAFSVRRAARVHRTTKCNKHVVSASQRRSGDCPSLISSALQQPHCLAQHALRSTCWFLISIASVGSTTRALPP